MENNAMPASLVLWGATHIGVPHLRCDIVDGDNVSIFLTLSQYGLLGANQRMHLVFRGLPVTWEGWGEARYPAGAE